MEEKLVETIVLDNGIEYEIIEEQEINNRIYTLFANVNNETDICFRKTIVENGEKFYIGLDNENELNLVAMHFIKKYIK